MNPIHKAFKEIGLIERYMAQEFGALSIFAGITA